MAVSGVEDDQIRDALGEAGYALEQNSGDKYRQQQGSKNSEKNQPDC